MFGGQFSKIDFRETRKQKVNIKISIISNFCVKRSNLIEIFVYQLLYLFQFLESIFQRYSTNILTSYIYIYVCIYYN